MKKEQIIYKTMADMKDTCKEMNAASLSVLIKDKKDKPIGALMYIDDPILINIIEKVKNDYSGIIDTKNA